MALVTAADLSDYLKETVPAPAGDAAIRAAEAAVAAYIDTDSLDRLTVTEVVYTARNTNLVEIAQGPLVNLQSVLINGLPSTDTWETSPWAIQRQDLIPAGARVEVTYDRGWTAADVPEQVRTAILATAAEIWARPDAAVVRIGTEGLLTAYNRTFITPSVEILLRRYRRPR